MSNSVEGLLSALSAEGQKLAINEPGSREKTIMQARRLIATLETPMEALLQIIWAEPTRYAVIRLALDLKVFETLAEDSRRPKTLAELCVPRNADVALVRRLARHLAATGVITEAGRELYVATPLAKSLIEPDFAAGVIALFDTTHNVFAVMPSYFDAKNWKNPIDDQDGPFQHAHGPINGFTWLNQNPKVMEAFVSYMFRQRRERPSWVDPGFYPIKDRLIEGVAAAGDASAIVDVGGAVGLCLVELQTKVPEWKGRLILQEQESVTSQIKGLDPRIEIQTHDFFQPQPVKGARAYYLRDILHNWPNDRCRLILTRLKDAMTLGYSKVLLNECVVADEGASWQHTSLDMYMMSFQAAEERTETQWRDLIESVGLEVTGIWAKGEGNEAIIEITRH
ncbi:MAG: hypothetical protein M1820_008321 [Bogoriella megaspora]|nr:MAG: hypothetical protein M1820_008321 [Bogoriella megaspora]